MYAAFVLIGVCIFMFLLQVSVSGFTEFFVLVSADVFLRPWTMVTAIFLHGDMVHLLYNMFALGLFGTILESIIGKKRFLAIFFSAGLLASFGTTALYSAALGASGAIFGILGALAILRPRMQVFVSYIPMPMIVAAVFWAAGDIIGLFVPSNVANLAHLTGLAFGVGAGLYYRKKFGERADGREIFRLDDEEFDDWEKKYMR